MSCRFTAHSLVGIIVLAALFAALGCKSGPREPPAVAAGTSIDPRTAVVLPADDQQAVLREMRQMLGAVGGVMAAAAKEKVRPLHHAILMTIIPHARGRIAMPPDRWRGRSSRVPRRGLSRWR